MRADIVSTKEKTSDEILATWIGLNYALTLLGEEQCVKLLEREKVGKKRKQILLRIHSRINKLRAERERRELIGISQK